MRCKYLDNQVCVRSDGQYRLCCVSLEGNNKETVHTHTPQEWHDGEFHSKVTEQMENDIWPEACVRCEKQEEQGIDFDERSAETLHSILTKKRLEISDKLSLVFSEWKKSTGFKTYKTK